MLGTLVGVFFIAVAIQGLTLAGVSDWVRYVLSGATLVAAVAVSSIIRRQRPCLTDGQAGQMLARQVLNAPLRQSASGAPVFD